MPMWDLRCSQQWKSKYKSFGIKTCVVGRVVCDILNDHSAFKTPGTTHTVMWHHIQRIWIVKNTVMIHKGNKCCQCSRACLPESHHSRIVLCVPDEAHCHWSWQRFGSLCPYVLSCHISLSSCTEWLNFPFDCVHGMDESGASDSKNNRKQNLIFLCNLRKFIF
jgi:hypothetical protein